MPFILAGAVRNLQTYELRGTVMPRLLEVADLCSSNVSDTANRLLKRMDSEGSPSVAEEKTSAVPPISQRSHVGNLRQAIQGKGVIHKRVETVGVYPLVRPRGVSALPAEVQRKPPRPLGANTLTQFACPAQPVQRKRLPPGRGEHACQANTQSNP